VKILAAIFTYLVALLVVGCIAFIVVIVLAGPHAGLLPLWLEVIVAATGWLSVLIVPLVLARKVWRRFARNDNTALLP
jgi:hypothetical protein